MNLSKLQSEAVALFRKDFAKEYPDGSIRWLRGIWIEDIETLIQDQIQKAYKAGIKEVLRNVEYNAQTKIWEIPEEKLLSIQSNKKRNKREIKTIMKYEFTRKEIIERKRNADYNAYELDYIQKQINAVKKQQVEGKITPQQAQKRIDSLNRWLHEQNWKCEKLEKLLLKK